MSNNQSQTLPCLESKLTALRVISLRPDHFVWKRILFNPLSAIPKTPILSIENVGFWKRYPTRSVASITDVVWIVGQLAVAVFSQSFEKKKNTLLFMMFLGWANEWVTNQMFWVYTAQTNWEIFLSDIMFLKTFVSATNAVRVGKHENICVRNSVSFAIFFSFLICFFCAWPFVWFTTSSGIQMLPIKSRFSMYGIQFT